MLYSRFVAYSRHRERRARRAHQRFVEITVEHSVIWVQNRPERSGRAAPGVSVRSSTATLSRCCRSLAPSGAESPGGTPSGTNTEMAAMTASAPGASGPNCRLRRKTRHRRRPECKPPREQQQKAPFGASGHTRAANVRNQIPA